MTPIKCQMCGSPDMTVKGHLIVCNYCGTRFSDDGYVSEAIKETRDPTLRSNVILAYKMNDKDAENVFYEWLKGGDFTPADINEAATVTEAKKLYIPGWFLKGTYEGSWTASSGYDRKEEYQVWEEHYRTVNGERQPVNELVTKTRVVTDWRPSSGNLHGAFSTLKFANDKIDPGLSTFIADKTTWNSNDLVDFDSFDNTAYEFVPFQLPYEQCYERYKPELNAIIRNSFTVPGDRYTDLSINSTASYNATQIYYPVYVYEYSYKGEHHKAIIDGRDRLNIYGTRPKDETIIKKANLSFAPLILTTILSYIVLVLIAAGFLPTIFDEGYQATDVYFIPALTNLLVSLTLTITLYNTGKYNIRNMVKKSHQARGNTSSVYNDLDTETAAIRHKIMNSGKINFWVHFVITLLVSLLILFFAFTAWQDSRAGGGYQTLTSIFTPFGNDVSEDDYYPKSKKDFVGTYTLMDFTTGEAKDITLEIFKNGSCRLVNGETGASITRDYTFMSTEVRNRVTPNNYLRTWDKDDYNVNYGTLFLTRDRNGIFTFDHSTSPNQNHTSEFYFEGCVFVRDVKNCERTLAYAYLAGHDWYTINEFFTLYENFSLDDGYQPYSLADDNKTVTISDGQVFVIDRENNKLLNEDGSKIYGSLF